MSLLLPAFFFLSGLAGLLYQIVWLKYFTLLFGATTPSVTAILAAFMGGLSLGSHLFGRWSARIRRPVLWYGAMEVAVGSYALLVPVLFAGEGRIFTAAYRLAGGEGILLTAFRFAFAALLFLPPTLLMGGTLPLLARWAERGAQSIGRRTGLLYGVNTLGAFAGVMLGTFWAVPVLGFGKTAHLAAAVNLLVGAGGIALGWRLIVDAQDAMAAAPAGIQRGLVFFVMGFTSLGYEVYWSRILAIHIGSNVYAYGLMLAVILMGIGLGSLLFGALPGKSSKPASRLGALETILAAVMILQIALFAVFPSVLTWLAGLPWPEVRWQVFGSLFLGTASVLFAPALLMGFSFPLCVRWIAPDAARAGEGAGSVYAWNTFGAIAGTFAAGLIAVPLLGTLRGLLLFAGLNAALGIVLCRGWMRLPALAAAAALLVMGFTLDPRLLFLSSGQYHDVKARIVDFHEDATGAVMVVRRPEGLSLEINGVNVAGTSPDNALIQKLQGHLPFALCPDARRVLHIGLGSGSTAHAVSLHPVEAIRVAEISPGIVRQARRHFLDYNGGVLADPRLKVSIMDGRNYVLASPERFDLILSDSIHPKYLGNGFLYTKEYFALVRARLAPGGAASMWLPMYSLSPKNFKEILRAFRDVFPRATLWWYPEPPNAFTVVMGGDAAPTLGNIRAFLSVPAVKRELAAAGLPSWEAVAAGCLLGPDGLACLTRDAAPHSDDRPTVEYESNRLFTKTSTWALNLKELYRCAERPEEIFRFQPVPAAVSALAQKYRGEMRDQILRLLASPEGP